MNKQFYHNQQYQRPPPPPPPPPPQQHVQPLGSQTARQIRVAAIVPPSSRSIKPTTAGLLQYPAISSEPMQQVRQVAQTQNYSLLPDPMNSGFLKDELLERHFHLASANSNSKIEDRIKLRKNEANKRLLSTVSPSEQESPHQMTNMPEKLFSTLQREKKPFAYTPDVNDPNNRGKLDLTQIKSPAMRRRLQANMESSSESDEENELQSKQTIHKTSSIIRYNAPPHFYNTNLTMLSPQVNNSSQSFVTRNIFDDLNDEVAESLNSLSLLVDNLQNQSSIRTQTTQRQQQQMPQSIDHAEDRSQQRARQQNQQYQRMSTFSPGHMPDSMRLGNSSGSYSSSPAYSSSDRSIGDYLLAPDSNYFSMGSSSSPYSVSPYYGSQLGVENSSVGPIHDYTQAKQISAKIFSPNYDTSNTSDYY